MQQELKYNPSHPRELIKLFYFFLLALTCSAQTTVELGKALGERNAEFVVISNRSGEYFAEHIFVDFLGRRVRNDIYSLPADSTSDFLDFGNDGNDWRHIESLVYLPEVSYVLGDEQNGWTEIDSPGFGWEKIVRLMRFDNYFNVPARVKASEVRIREAVSSGNRALAEKIILELERFKNPPSQMERKVVFPDGSSKTEIVDVATDKKITKITDKYSNNRTITRFKSNFGGELPKSLFSVVDVKPSTSRDSFLSRPSLGLYIKPLDEGAFLVDKVVPRSPGAGSGIKDGDILFIEDTDGNPITDVGSLVSRITQMKDVNVQVVSNGGRSRNVLLSPIMRKEFMN